jgi:hypothetical protein
MSHMLVVTTVCRGRPAIKAARVILTLALCAVSLFTAACKKGPELTCKVNDVCFVCPDEKAQAKCIRDPSGARCKYAEPSHCK